MVRNTRGPEVIQEVNPILLHPLLCEVSHFEAFFLLHAVSCCSYYLLPVGGSDGFLKCEGIRSHCCAMCILYSIRWLDLS